MKILSNQLKALLKKLGSARSENLYLDSRRMVAWDSDLLVLVNQGVVDGPVTINLRKFSSVVSRLSGEIDLAVSDKGLSLKSARASVLLERVAAKPPAHQIVKLSLSLPLATVKSLLSYAITSADPNKAVDGGGVVQISTLAKGIEDNTIVKLRSVGTNTIRLALAEADTTQEQPFSLNIPLAAAIAIQGLDGEILGVAETEKLFVFSAGDVEITAVKLAKPYPNYGAYIPKEFKYQFEIPAEAAKQALRVVEPLIENDENACVVHFLDNSMVVRSIGGGGSAEDALETVQVKPDPVFDAVDFRILLNHRYLADFFGAVTGSVTFEANGPDKPVILRVPGKTLLICPTVEKK